MSFRDKKAIRENILSIRNKMNKEEVNNLSEKIMSKLTKLPIYIESKTIMMYLSFNNEVDSIKTIEQCLEDGKKVILPFCVKENMQIIPTEIESIDISTEKNSIGYIQPKKETLKPVETDIIDLIVVPGIAFDKRCHRIGFGAGYYDRFLGKLNHTIPTIGIAYDYQILESFLETESHDISLDYVITENSIIIRP